MKRVRKVLVELYGHANERVMAAVRDAIEDACEKGKCPECGTNGSHLCHVALVDAMSGK